MFLDRQPALRMEQRSGHAHRLEWRLQRWDIRKAATKRIASSFRLQALGLPECFDKRSFRELQAARQLLDSVGRHYGADGFSLAEILKLPRDDGDALVEYVEGRSRCFRQNDRRLFGIAMRFVGKAPPGRVDLETAFHDRRP